MADTVERRGGAAVCRRLRATVWLAIVIAGVFSAPRAFGYSALTHEAIIDSAWDDGIKPLLLKKFPGASDEELQRAHGFAYGGCIIQDMGYYPFGNPLFTKMLHYVRSGDFVENMINDAQPIEEYAFALGALEHYVADSIGHPLATNHAVPLNFPRLRHEYGDVVTYEEDPQAHMQMEFGFDVLQVARGRYTPEAHEHFIGFAVSESVLQRAFYTTYGLLLADVLEDVDLAIGTYRHTVSFLIPAATKIAWEMKHDEIVALLPQISREQFVYAPPDGSYEQKWGNHYSRPAWYHTVIAFVFRIVPKFGPVAALDLKVLTPESEELYQKSFDETAARYETMLHTLRTGRLQLRNLDLDTGQPVAPGEYALADETYAALLDKLADRSFATATPALRNHLVAFYRNAADTPLPSEDKKEWQHVRQELVELESLPPAGAVAER